MTLMTLITTLWFIVLASFIVYGSYTNTNTIDCDSSIISTNKSSIEMTKIVSHSDIDALYDIHYDNYIKLSNNYNKIIYLILIIISIILPTYHMCIYNKRTFDLILTYALIKFFCETRNVWCFYTNLKI